MSEKKKIAKAAGIVSAFTFLSRILGFVRDMVIARYFGAGLSADAFFVAFRIPNLLRKMLAEGALTISFIPVFTEYLETKSKKDAFELANTVFTALSIVLVSVSFLGILFSPLIVRLLAPGFTDTSEKMELTVLLTRIMFPYIFFIGLTALCMGILNSLRHFAAPAFFPVLLNISIIAAVLYLSQYFDPPVVSLAIGVMIGGVAQLLFQLPFLKGKGVSFKLNFNFSHPAVKKIGVLMVPAVFGASVYQLNIFVSTIVASFLPEGSVSYLYYANRLIEFPLGLFAVAVGTAVLPSMSQYAARKDFENVKKTLSFALRLVFFVTLPAMLGLIVLRVPIISILFQRGQFSPQVTLLTADALFYYSLGLWAIAGTRIVLPTFYSLQDTKTPVKVAMLIFFVDICLSIILAFPLGLRHGGLALATSISSTLSLLILLMILRKRLGPMGGRKILRSTFKTCLSSIMMAVVLHLYCLRIPWSTEAQMQEQILILGSGIIIGGAVFYLCSYLLKSHELYDFIEIVKGKTAGNKRL